MNENKYKISPGVVNQRNNTQAALRPARGYRLAIMPLLLSISIMLVPEMAYADAGLCKVQPASVLNTPFSADGKTHLQADQVNADEKNLSRFSGNVIIQQAAKSIETDLAEYDKKNERISATGNIRLLSPSIEIKSDSANFNLKSDQAILHNAEYQSLTSRARGNASEIEIKSATITELTNATYTTCDADKVDWFLSADNITLNNENRQGSASHVVIRFKDVPFFYFPYLRFPLGEDRLSGFFFPSFGSSDKHGTEEKLPYYWNIHPQLDATITPWNMTKRGLMLQTEFRYLSESSKGTFYNESLNHDKIFNQDRQRLSWQHQSTPGLGWKASSDINYVADSNHLIDFSDDLASSSTTHLIRTVNVAHNSQNWLLNINAENHQILSGTEPYKRLPQITLNSLYASKDNQLNFSLQSEAVRFDHVNDTKVKGERLHIKPGVSYPLRSASGFLIPSLSVQQTMYNLNQPTGETTLSRTVPTFSLDGGLFFERDSQLFSNHYIQTLEPQLFYVYVPYKDQAALPVFDTSVYAFNINNPFTDYRFNSIDRIGDDNRLTTAVTTRFINQQNGQEVFMARLGQISYFTERKVQLPLTPVDTSSRSNIIAELKTHPGDWTLASQLEWDPALNQKVSSTSQLGYHYKNTFSFNAAYHFQRQSLETREMQLNWKLSPHWNISTSHLYDLRNRHVVENLYGIVYESCCWALKLSAKERFISSTQKDDGIYLELELRGLGGFGYSQSRAKKNWFE